MLQKSFWASTGVVVVVVVVVVAVAVAAGVVEDAVATRKLLWE